MILKSCKTIKSDIFIYPIRICLPMPNPDDDDICKEGGVMHTESEEVGLSIPNQGDNNLLLNHKSHS